MKKPVAKIDGKRKKCEVWALVKKFVVKVDGKRRKWRCRSGKYGLYIVVGDDANVRHRMLSWYVLFKGRYS